MQKKILYKRRQIRRLKCFAVASEAKEKQKVSYLVMKVLKKFLQLFDQN